MVTHGFYQHRVYRRIRILNKAHKAPSSGRIGNYSRSFNGFDDSELILDHLNIIRYVVSL